jgi:pyruvate kinase
MLNTRAKIVCTLGPSSSDYETIKELILTGMNVARLNFSHGTHEEHQALIENIRRASRDTGRLLGILLDLQGPKIRVGRFAQGQAALRAGARFTITGREVEGDETIVSSTYRLIAQDVHPGERILLDDGNLALRVVEVNAPDVVCEVTLGGVLKNNKGINIPGAALSVDTITEKDLKDVEFGIRQDVDFLAMSFVRHPDDLRRMRAYLDEAGARLPIIAKIEKPQALEHIEEIVAVSNGIMVARGDLGVEMAPEEVPAIQKKIISLCNGSGVPVITATQMLESMVNNPRPTRAEASDVANAILDGSDAVMLSAESASGRYPVEAVAVMKRIIHATEESHRSSNPASRRRRFERSLTVPEGVAVAACQLAELVNAKAIASITLTGSMARQLSTARPVTALYAISQFEQVLRQLSLNWGIEGILMPDLNINIDDAVLEVEAMLVARQLLAKGEALVLTAGLPFSERQATNMVRVDVVK